MGLRVDEYSPLLLLLVGEEEAGLPDTGPLRWRRPWKIRRVVRRRLGRTRLFDDQFGNDYFTGLVRGARVSLRGGRGRRLNVDGYGNGGRSHLELVTLLLGTTVVGGGSVNGDVLHLRVCLLGAQLMGVVVVVMMVVLAVAEVVGVENGILSGQRGGREARRRAF